jgi:hypothetical protein
MDAFEVIGDPTRRRLIELLSEGERGAPMKADYWNVTDEQVIEKTGKTLAHWKKGPQGIWRSGQEARGSVEHLQSAHGVPRYWARTLTTGFMKAREATRT